MTRPVWVLTLCLTLCALGRADEVPPLAPIPSPVGKILYDVPLVEQTTNWTCGAAAMQAVLAYYGLSFSEADLALQMGSTPKEGTDHNRMAQFARDRGIGAVVKSNLTLKDLAESIEKGNPPLIEAQAYSDDKTKPYKEMWNSGHYLVVIGLDDKYVYFIDSSAGMKRAFLPIEEFLERWHDLGEKNVKLEHTAILFTGTPKPVPVPRGWVKVQ